ncbi:MAG: hypothetical protein J6O71_03265 [Lachnospiraceae bacterium]|nr:hypothetical protein [Lachnospiraceae bacterium]
MRSKKIISLLLLLPAVLLCGFFFDKPTVLVDTDSKQVYEYVPADDVLSDFAGNVEEAKRKYTYGYYYISGKVRSVSKTGDTLLIQGASAADDHIVCSCPKELTSQALTFSAGDGIGVFGRISDNLFDRDIHLVAEKLVSAPGGVKSGTYYLSDGTRIDKGSMAKRTLADDRAEFLIPASWKGVEHSIVKEGLGTIDGYQYVLNKLPGSRDNTPESLFICYFDNASRLEIADDKKETNLIEKAIINNISGEGKADSFRTRKNEKTYYGATYDYFVGSYTDALSAGSNGYHAEYIFHRDGEDGLVMYLYIYKNAGHLSDVMFVTRFLALK